MTTLIKLKAFHGDEAIKEKYLARVKAHAEADEIIKGTYWQEGKGCAVGCTIHDSDHGNYETEIGVPMVIAKLEDRIFEGMSNDKAKEFPVKFIESINVGADLSLVWSKFAIWLLDDPEHGVGRHIKTPKPAFDKVVTAYKKMVKGEAISLTEWRAIRDEAWSERRATYAASASAYAASASAYAASAYAADASDADASDAASAYAASAYAADASDAASAYAADARSKSFDRQAEKLLELLAEAK